jgi:hypothetical protein
MASTQPLPPIRTSPLRALRKVSAKRGSTDLSLNPIFDLNTAPDLHLAEVKPFSITDDLPEVPHAPIGELPADLDAPPRAYSATARPQTGDLQVRQTGYLKGVSLAAILQMLHLERKSCVVEVSAHGWLGSLTLVNGELVDASFGDLSGEEAACLILNWPNPQTSILDRIDLFRNTVHRPITQLIMDAARIVDETASLDPAHLPEHAASDSAGTGDDLQWLIDSLALGGASNIQILSPDTLPAEQRHAATLSETAGDLARGIRTWASLLGPDVTEVVATRGDHTAVLALLDADRGEFIYAEAPSLETTELVRRSLRSIRR